VPLKGVLPVDKPRGAPPNKLPDENTLFEVLPAAVVLLAKPPNKDTLPPTAEPLNKVVPFA